MRVLRHKRVFPLPICVVKINRVTNFSLRNEQKEKEREKPQWSTYFVHIYSHRLHSCFVYVCTYIAYYTEMPLSSK